MDTQKKTCIFDEIINCDKTLTSVLAVCSNNRSSYSRMRPLMRLLEYSCHGIPWFVGVVVATLVCHQLETRKKLINLFCALLFDICIVGLIKAVVRRQRPAHNTEDQLVISVDKYSFPSGHATRAALVTCLFLSKFSFSCVQCSCLVVWASCVTMSRILLGRHHVSDVVCGSVIGLLQYLFINSMNFWQLFESSTAGILQFIEQELHI